MCDAPCELRLVLCFCSESIGPADILVRSCVPPRVAIIVVVKMFRQQLVLRAAPLTPDLEGYVPRRTTVLPKWAKWIPTSHADIIRLRVNARLWRYFTGRIHLQKIVGTAAVAMSSYLFVCWLDGVAPYFALSEDPNTAFQHPHWVKVANERTKRERELRQRVESTSSSSLALESATRSYTSMNAGDRLS